MKIKRKAIPIYYFGFSSLVVGFLFLGTSAFVGIFDQTYWAEKYFQLAATTAVAISMVCFWISKGVDIKAKDK